MCLLMTMQFSPRWSVRRVLAAPGLSHERRPPRLMPLRYGRSRQLELAAVQALGVLQERAPKR